MRPLIAVVALAMLPLIHGCAAVALGGAAAAGGYLVGEDRRAANIMADDQAIELRVGQRVGAKFPDAHVNSTSYNRLVLITGEVPTAAGKAEIEQVVRSVEGVRGTFNELQVGPVAPLSARAHDAYLTSVVKSRFLDGRRFNPIHVKVVTEAGTVFLMGLVKKQEAADATELASTTRGVNRVVRVFEYQD